MARGGINQVLVERARQALIARGEHPSIDAVRIELGNTGSKSTIHRYLKAIDASTPETEPATLNAELSELVAHLADRLQGQADQRTAQAQAQFAQALEASEHARERGEQALTQLQQVHAIQGAALAGETEQRQLAQASLQAEQARNAQLSQALADAQLRLTERDQHIATLADQHQHAREALAHYRDAVKQQREQDQQRHEGQVQQAQMALRQLQQGMSLKHEEVARLNRDNERLLQQGREAASAQAQLQRAGEALQRESAARLQSLGEAQGARQVLQEHARELQADGRRMQQRNAELERDLARQQARVAGLEQALQKASEPADPVLAAAEPAVPERDETVTASVQTSRT